MQFGCNNIYFFILTVEINRIFMKKTVIIAKRLAIIFVIGFATTTITAQDRNIQSSESSIQNLPKITKMSAFGSFYARFDNENISSSFLTDNMTKWLGTNSDHTFKFIESSSDDLGFKRSSYQHYYKGVKVADELILIHEKDGKVTYVNGELSDKINITIKQPLSQSEVENIVNADMKAPNITFDEFDQVITKAYSGKNVNLYLVSQINALSLKTLKGYMYYIDTTTKRIVKKLEKIHHHNITPTNLTEPLKASNTTTFISPLVDTSSNSLTFYKGSQPITVDSYNGGYRLKDNGRNIHTQDGTGWSGGGIPGLGLTGTINEYINSTPNFTSTETKPPVEVHWAMKTSYDYYINRHNRNSYDGSGSIIYNYYNVNFNRNPTTGAGQDPISGVNAAAIDTQGIVAMVYGNGLYQGQPGYFNPFVPLDVAGHEYSHLIVSRTANLAYQAESGALNEAFADIFGASIEFYSGITPNWTIGEGVPNPALGFTFLRSMSNPNSGPAALSSQQPDTYNGTYWTTPTPPFNQANDFGGVHRNSGVGNYWFYLLSAGGTGTNDMNTAFNVTGITIQKAEKIAYRTLATYLTANSTFADAYTASKQATIDLYGAGSNELQQVENAWCAVGLGNCATLLSVNDLVNSDSDSVKIYPNPTNSGEFNIESTIRESAFYDIYDLSGKIIKSTEKLEKGINKVNINGVQSGVYMVKIKTNGSTFSKKVIVK